MRPGLSWRWILPKDHRSTPARPTAELQFPLASFPLLAHRLPATLSLQNPNQLFDSFGAALPKQIVLRSALTLAHHPFIAEIGVAADQPSSLCRSQPIPQPPQVLQPVHRGVFLSRTHFHIQGHAQGAQKNRVVSVAGAAWLVRVVAQVRSFLVAVDGLDGHIQIRDPRLFQSRSIRLQKSLGLPLVQSRGVLIFKGPPQTVFTDHFLHSQALGIDLITTQRAHMGVTAGAAQNTQHRRSQYVPHRRRVRTGITQRTTGNPLGVKARSGQKLAEEDQLAQRRDRRQRIPFHMHAATDGIHRQRRHKHFACGSLKLVGSFTLRVSRHRRNLRTHAPCKKQLRRFSSSAHRRIKVDPNDQVRAGGAGAALALGIEVVDHAFWRALQLAALILVGFFITAILLLLVTRRLFSIRGRNVRLSF